MAVQNAVTMTTASAEETSELGFRTAQFLKSGDIVALKGELGSGKTTFVRGLVDGLAEDRGEQVTSPTFVLMHEYSGRTPVYHIDGYRLKDEEDAREAGLEEFFYADAIVVVEWAERFEKIMPKATLVIQFKILDENHRQVTLHGDDKLLEKFKQGSK